MAKVRYEYVIDDITGERGRRKLAHYNAWLGDPNRDFGSVYPGFPEDYQIPEQKDQPEEEPAKPVTKSRKKGCQVTEVVDTVKTDEKAVKGPREGTKLATATALVQATGKDDKEACLKAIVEALAVTRGNASIYYTKALALLG